MAVVTCPRATRGFTLVELLIVVIILAILSAIVIPQFSNTSTEAKEAALDANLAALRTAIELYRAQHGDYPGAKGTAPTVSGSCASPGVAGSAAANSAAALIEQLTRPSDAGGGTCTVADTTNFRFGPYLRKGVPNEPINNKGSLAADIAITSTGAPISAGTAGGWAYDTKSGQIVMNSTANDSRGNPYSAR
ncbi:MAG TPA: prepilin-type N-terminal cleavage/methylation domain-containing protein [Burkholderiaceae bacterium]|nr:prepilin-type N-terminal cleavage/methylation domain-containing protein [Burkholderiaceae bacterium]